MRGLKLKYKVTIAFLLFIVAPFLVMGWYSAYKTSESMKDEIGRTTLQLVNQNHVTIEKTLSAVNDKTVTLLDTHFFSNPEQYKFWTGVDTLGEYTAADSILEKWSSDGTQYSLYMSNREGKQMPLQTLNKEAGFQYVEESGAGTPDWVRETLGQGGASSLRLISLPDGETTISFLRGILNPNSYYDVMGLLVVTKLEVLLTRDLVSVEMPDGASSFLFNDRNERLMKAGSPSSELIEIPDRIKEQTSGYYFASEHGAKWLYAFSRKSAFETTLIYKIPYESITGNQSTLLGMLTVLSALYLCVVLVFILYVLRIVVKPLGKLISITKLYEPGKKLELGSEQLRSDEFGILYGAILKMTRRLDRSVEENYGMQLKQREYELMMLHSHITPHLLYNTLDSIYWYARDRGNKDVGYMVKDLSKLLRIGLSKGRIMITIEEELEHVRAYTRLQNKRYPGMFEVEWHVDETLLSFVLPKVIIQPLVENAIFHGVSGMEGDGVILIRVERCEDEVRLSVEDNGFVSVDIERLARIVRGEETDKGYGIRNVHQRIQLHYGEAYGLRYERVDGDGLRAVIHMPLRKQA
ncbi:sensor histidine kinase [Paenibacillus sp. HB172176]|uniref:sensor histidine kinase n=1 Tax=Paenibacillus sp. HB172176 TaxID=2493690 RepID=UPI001439D316|nr:sensor histidine kinase [Paenibacillus sp. HB172176]